MKTVEWILRQLRSLGPYFAVELLLPGGSIVALLLWTYRHRTAARPAARQSPVRNGWLRRCGNRALELSTMLTRFLRATLPGVLAGMFWLQPAHADLYTWVDTSGGINVSNLAPPEGARITNVILASAPKTTTRDEDAREAARDAEVQALAKRVRQLEDQIESQGSGSNRWYYWYYCRDPAGFYPDAQTCPSRWLQVVPNPTADTAAGM